MAVHDDRTLGPEQKRERIRQIHLETYDRIKPFLTPDQIKKHEEMKMKMQKGVRGRGECGCRYGRP